MTRDQRLFDFAQRKLLAQLSAYEPFDGLEAEHHRAMIEGAESIRVFRKIARLFSERSSS